MVDFTECVARHFEGSYPPASTWSRFDAVITQVDAQGDQFRVVRADSFYGPDKDSYTCTSVFDLVLTRQRPNAVP